MQPGPRAFTSRTAERAGRQRIRLAGWGVVCSAVYCPLLGSRGPLYSSSVTWDPQWGAPSVMERWVMKLGGGTVPVLFSVGSEDDVAGFEFHDPLTAGLDETSTFGDVEG